jgi:hypothetical protein
MTLNDGRACANFGKAMHSKDKVKRSLVGAWLRSKNFIKFCDRSCVLLIARKIG